MVTTKVDSMREAWLDLEDGPDYNADELEDEPSDDELEEQANDHVLRAWDYLADNSEVIDNVLRQFIEDPAAAIPMRDQADVTGLLRASVDATKDGPADFNRPPSMYVLLKAAKFLIEGQLTKGDLSIGMTEQMTDWLRDANRYFTNTK